MIVKTERLQSREYTELLSKIVLSNTRDELIRVN